MVDTVLFPSERSLIDLPSGGKFYPLGHPLCGQSHIEFFHMRAAEEDILTNRDYLKRDIAVEKLVHSVLVNDELKKDVNFSEILIADFSAIILNLRILAYTNDYEVSVSCPKCKETSKYIFDLNEYKYSKYDFSNDEDVLYNEQENLFHIKIPNTKILVKIYPNTIGIQRKIKNKLLNKKNKELTNKDMYEDLIHSINDSKDLKLIDLFFKQIPAFYLKWLITVIDDINPKLSLSQNFECKHCGYEEEIEPPFTTSFLFVQKINRKKT